MVKNNDDEEFIMPAGRSFNTLRSAPKIESARSPGDWVEDRNPGGVDDVAKESRFDKKSVLERRRRRRDR